VREKQLLAEKEAKRIEKAEKSVEKINDKIDSRKGIR
jgi:hypothetical protein